MSKATMKNHQKIYFDNVSEMAREENRLDYASMVDWCTDGSMVSLHVSPWKMAEDWELQYESDDDDNDEDENDEDEDDEDEEVFQWFIIGNNSARYFLKFTNELIYYSEELDMYLLGVDHWGTPWSGVMTEWKLGEE